MACGRHTFQSGFGRGPESIPLAEPDAMMPTAGGGIVASLARSPVLAYVPKLGAPVKYVGSPTLAEAVIPISPPKGMSSLFRSKTALVRDCP